MLIWSWKKSFSSSISKLRNLDYYNNLIIIVEGEVWCLWKLKQMQKSEYEAVMGRQEGIHTAVAQDVANIFKNKLAAALDTLQANI